MPEDIRDEEHPCDACGRTRRLLVCAIPGIPISLARCMECLTGDVLPLWLLVANTCAIGGLDRAADWWTETVQDSLTALEIPRERFDELVAEALEVEGRQMRELERAELEAASQQSLAPEPRSSSSHVGNGEGGWMDVVDE